MTEPVLAPLAIDADAIASLRDILVDPDATLYPDFTILRALRDNRALMLYRDPVYSSGSIYPFQTILRARQRIPVTPTDPWNSQLLPEPDGKTWQAQPHVRHWDSQTPVYVWMNGVLQTAALYALSADPFAVDFPSGRVQFTYSGLLPTYDYQTVNATFAYYKVYDAARQILLGTMGSNAQVSIKLSDVVVGISIKDAIDALDQLIATMQPAAVPVERRLY